MSLLLKILLPLLVLILLKPLIFDGIFSHESMSERLFNITISFSGIALIVGIYMKWCYFQEIKKKLITHPEIIDSDVVKSSFSIIPEGMKPTKLLEMLFR